MFYYLWSLKSWILFDNFGLEILKLFKTRKTSKVILSYVTLNIRDSYSLNPLLRLFERSGLIAQFRPPFVYPIAIHVKIKIDISHFLKDDSEKSYRPPFFCLNILNGNDCACLRFEEICLYFYLYKFFRERLWSPPPYLEIRHIRLQNMYVKYTSVHKIEFPILYIYRDMPC